MTPPIWRQGLALTLSRVACHYWKLRRQTVSASLPPLGNRRQDYINKS